jgi:hypothetical protein
VSKDFTVVWSGKDSLLPDRAERWDGRFAGMPSYDVEEGPASQGATVTVKRQYNRTGKHVGKCSRTNPNAPQYIPKKVT